MATFHHPLDHVFSSFSELLNLIIAVVLVIHFQPSYGGPLNGTDLVKEVCYHTSDDKFCVDTLLSDKNAGASEALAGELVNAALRFAQGKASDTRLLIADLLNKTSSFTDRQFLQRCENGTSNSIAELSLANSDFNSDTFGTMVEEMRSAANSIEDCQNAIRGSPQFSSLANMNAHVIKLCEIGIISTQYLSAEDFY